MAVEGVSAIITHTKENPNECKQEVRLFCEPKKLASQKIRLSHRLNSGTDFHAMSLSCL